MQDMSGRPRSDEDLQDAINLVKKLMLRPPMTMPELVVLLPTMHNLLQELEQRRKVDNG